LIVQGGVGGRGNEAFKSSTNTAPTLAEKGEQGQEVWLSLELKLVADVGIIGVPNSGTVLTRSVLRTVCVAHSPFWAALDN
jgi:GTPase